MRNKTIPSIIERVLEDLRVKFGVEVYDDKVGFVSSGSMKVDKEALELFRVALTTAIEEVGNEIIGQDGALPFRVRAGEDNRPKDDECPYCWAKTLSYHEGGCLWYETQMKNSFMEEQRKKLSQLLRGL